MKSVKTIRPQCKIEKVVVRRREPIRIVRYSVYQVGKRPVGDLGYA